MANQIITEINKTAPRLSREVSIEMVLPFAFTQYTIWLDTTACIEECKRLYIRLPSAAWIIQCTAINNSETVNLTTRDKDENKYTNYNNGTDKNIHNNISFYLISDDHYCIEYKGKELGDEASITVLTCSLMSLQDHQYSYQLPFLLSQKLLTKCQQTIPTVNYGTQEMVYGKAVIHSQIVNLTSNYKTQYVNNNTIKFCGILDIKLFIQISIPEQPSQVTIKTGTQLFLLSQKPRTKINNIARSHLHLVMLGSNKVLIKLISTIGLLIRHHLQQYKKNSVVSIQVNNEKVHTEHYHNSETYQAFYHRLISLLSLQIETHKLPLFYHCLDGLVAMLQHTQTPTKAFLFCHTNDTIYDGELDALKTVMGNSKHRLQIISLQSLVLTNPKAMFDENIVEYALPLPTKDMKANSVSTRIQGVISGLCNTFSSNSAQETKHYTNYQLTLINGSSHQEFLYDWCLNLRDLGDRIISSAHAKNYQTHAKQLQISQKEVKTTLILPCHGFTDRYGNNMEFQLNQLHEDDMLYTQLSSHDMDVHWQYLCSRNRTQRKSDLELSIQAMEKNSHNPQLLTIHLMKLTDIIDPLELSYINDIRTQHNGPLSQYIAQWMLVICGIFHISISAALRAATSDISNGLNAQAKADILLEFGH